MPRKPEVDSKTCARCTAPAKKDGYCGPCRAAYQREYEQIRAAQARGAGFAEGVEAMRKTLADEFQRIGMSMVSCLEVSRAIREAPAPRLAVADAQRLQRFPADGNQDRTGIPSRTVA